MLLISFDFGGLFSVLSLFLGCFCKNVSIFNFQFFNGPTRLGVKKGGLLQSENFGCEKAEPCKSDLGSSAE